MTRRQADIVHGEVLGHHENRIEPHTCHGLRREVFQKMLQCPSAAGPRQGPGAQDLSEASLDLGQVIAVQDGKEARFIVLQIEILKVPLPSRRKAGTSALHERQCTVIGGQKCTVHLRTRARNWGTSMSTCNQCAPALMRHVKMCQNSGM